MNDMYELEYKSDTKLNGYAEMLIRNGMLTKVEPCKHGNYARHVINVSVEAALTLPNPADALAWCDGKPEEWDEHLNWLGFPWKKTQT